MNSKKTLSQNRSLLSDLADGLGQQMTFWGHDVRHPGGNLLLAFGMERIERPPTQKEGSSRYRMPWQGGLIELHGFCAGWYPNADRRQGSLFIRYQERLQSTLGSHPHPPGLYDRARLGHLPPDDLLEGIAPFVSWWVAYEEWIQITTPAGYRADCWKNAKHLGRSKIWLPPREALHWLRGFLENPREAGRARPKSKRPAPASQSSERAWARKAA